MAESGGGIVETDETHIDREPGRRLRFGAGHKEIVFARIKRGGNFHSQRIMGKSIDSVKAALNANLSPDATFMTEDAACTR
jgi:hypothetical protein